MGYAELVKALQYCATHECMHEGEELVGCTAPFEEREGCYTCNDALMMKAADAIEALQRACANYAEQNEELQQEYDSIAKSFNEAAELLHNRQPKWIPAKERLPQEEKEYWCFCRGGAWKQLSWMDRYFWNGERFELPWGGEYDKVTHWMPLPAPPKGETE